ncbi:hypothetical protein GCM10011575_21390 [Microlunatus endophyticus]|uniref:TIGR03083 family protein n=1 Tax=Microlunatus endophyticus TaxID=1716077 RepID=A0A917W4S5_9ACTN|nr:maleylpyruvate isomerase family mycothiol-dependent enzyme [Microlunatus endophyticus]GGL62561.1 hypothetical protein GCM10011575_21390 [Microlunatus endophyticus]
MTASAIDPISGRPRDGSAGIDHLAKLARLQSAFAAGIAPADPTRPVPGIDNWTVRDLVVHLAGIHHWAAAQARAEHTSPLDRDPDDLPGLYASTAAELTDTLTELGPDRTGSTLLGPGPASFWHRRQVHETLIHLGDLYAAGSGRWSAEVFDGAVDLTPALWADGIDEVVQVMEPRQVRLGRIQPLARIVALHAVDAGATFQLGAHEDGRIRQDPAAVVSGPARDLLLVLWRRIPLESAGVGVDGDRSAVEKALATAITP